jgi:hypothetical protein
MYFSSRLIYANKKERNITGKLVCAPLLKQLPEDGIEVPKHVGVYVCLVCI